MHSCTHALYTHALHPLIHYTPPLLGAAHATGGRSKLPLPRRHELDPLAPPHRRYYTILYYTILILHSLDPLPPPHRRYYTHTILILHSLDPLPPPPRRYYTTLHYTHTPLTGSSPSAPSQRQQQQPWRGKARRAKMLQRTLLTSARWLRSCPLPLLALCAHPTVLYTLYSILPPAPARSLRSSNGIIYTILYPSSGPCSLPALIQRYYIHYTLSFLRPLLAPCAHPTVLYTLYTIRYTL
jgi:hypothetical protein